MKCTSAGEQLLKGIKDKDVKMVKQALLDKGLPDVKTSLFFDCVKHDFVEGVDTLVEAKASFLGPSKYDCLALCGVKSSPLLQAVLQGKELMVNKLLSHRAYFNKEIADRTQVPDFDIIHFPWRNGYTVLHHAAELDQPNMLRLLVEAKGNVDYVDGYESFRYTPLVRAIRAGQLENVQYLMQQVTDLSIEDDTGLTAWDHAHSESMLRLLKGETVDVKVQWKEYDSSLTLDKQLVKNPDVVGSFLSGIWKIIQFYPILVKGERWEFTLTKSPVVKSHRVTDEFVFTIACPSRNIVREDVSPAEVNECFQKLIL